MASLISKIYSLVFEQHISFRERLFRMILMVGGSLSFLGALETLLFTQYFYSVIPLVALVICFGISSVLTFGLHKFEQASILMAICMNIMVFPALFFLNGGIKGGASVWFVLEFFYIYIMFSGVKLIVFLILTIGTVSATFLVAYLFPEFIITYGNVESIYLDVIFGVFSVGMVIGGILRFQIRLLEKEQATTLRQKEKLEQASDYKNLFFTNMSHEIRTPINTIMGLDEMIMRKSSSEEIHRYAEHIQMAGKMLLTLINDILEISQLEMKRLEIIPMPYETRELFEELIDMIQVQVDQKELTLRINVDENLPSVLIGDKKRLKQIILNILTNAVKYTKNGSVTLTAECERIEDDKIRLVVSVSDTGIGIRKENLEHLYESFQRVDEKQNQQIEGNGLGLAITKQLLDLMGGEITVDSIYTKGSNFTISVEQLVSDATPLGIITPMQHDRIQRDNQYSYSQLFEAPEARILVVDDNEVNAMVTGTLLESTKVQVDIASSGKECLARTKQRYYHVILMDYMMPEMNGVEALKELRRQENGLCKDSCAIAMTASCMKDPDIWCKENGFDGYLEKPITGEQLEKTILKNLPGDVVEYRRDKVEINEPESGLYFGHGRNRKKVYITTDCVCDLPEELLEKYDIRLMYLYIQTKYGRFADSREIDADNLSEYISESNSTAHAISASVEEYEDFFAETLTRAEFVIHVSMAKNAGKSYGVAVAAAKGFDHVTVIDSGHISGGEGLVTLYAAKLAKEGVERGQIIEAVTHMRDRIVTRFIMPTPKIFYQNGYTSAMMDKLYDIFRFHPVLSMKKSYLMITGVTFGELENCWKRYIRRHFFRKRRINTDIVVITHVCCTVRQLELIKREIARYVTFKRVIVQKGSFSNACNSGMKTIGISFYLKN